MPTQPSPAPALAGDPQSRLFGVALVCALLAPLPASALPLVNASFESGLSGWTIANPSAESEFPPPGNSSGEAPWLQPAGSVKVEQSWAGWTHDLHALAEENFLSVGTGDAYFIHGDTHHITASQTVTLQRGDVLSGWSAFFNGDHGEQDTAWVKVFDSWGTEVANPWLQTSGSATPATVPYLDASAWSAWQWAPASAGDFTLVLGATTFGDNVLPSYGFHDGIAIEHVPDTGSTIALASAALGLLAMMRVKRRRSGA